MSIYQVLRELQIVLAVILGACPLCHQPVTLDRSPPPSPEPNKVLLAAEIPPKRQRGSARGIYATLVAWQPRLRTQRMVSQSEY
jgi:hypothetical protein